MSRHVVYSLIQKCIYLTLVVIVVIADKEKCNETECLGPLMYYKSLGCKPVYENEGDCCAIKYDCDHLKQRSKNKCYVNNKAYEIGESLKDEDANSCDMGCFCVGRENEAARFICPVIDCPPFENTECHAQYYPTKCCPDIICDEKSGEKATCVVDGKTYKNGDFFKVASDPELNCVCQPGYEGKNVAPFCAKPNRMHCDPYFDRASNVQNHCAPVYRDEKQSHTGCYLSHRCQAEGDHVIHTHESHEEVDEENVCLFGDLELHLDDELNQKSKSSPTCTKCVCKIPPVPTCVQLPSDKCDES